MIKWLNTPIEDVVQSVINLYGDIDCEICFDYGLIAEGNYGVTTFCDDGTKVITLAIETTLDVLCETLAHELAHVIVGIEHDHDEVWEKCFDSIHKEYNRYCKEKYKVD
ncbi:hypothetical protein [Clostridioides difficile]|jgi:hypothetical protein|uniref:hypothetical protein n=1 Tax=Clostridioides difficile TaxID=1496 RepID=UPI00097FE914|nr:hypothetical protein [Clostridioides difficile]SJP48374.1 Uncharacterised protein [Clostridioides difficile]DAL24670.1 MAG TPA_asm: hydrolase [Caudoviricetes sp.]